MKPEDASGSNRTAPCTFVDRERGNDNCFYMVLADKMKEDTSKSAVSMFYHWQKDTEHLFMYTMSR